MEKSTIKKILFVVGFVVLGILGHAQTIIPANTTAHDFALMKGGQYRIITATDTTDLTLNSGIILVDTIPKVCPVCPPPVKCPAQRSFVGYTYNPKTNQWIITYNDGSTTIFVPTTTITIK